MKVGATYNLLVSLDSLDMLFVKSIIFTLKGVREVTKIYPGDVTFDDNEKQFSIPLNQKETIYLVSNNGEIEPSVDVEAQVNFLSGAVAKTSSQTIAIDESVATHIIEGNVADGTQYVEIVLTIDGTVIYGGGGSVDVVSMSVEQTPTGADITVVDNGRTYTASLTNGQDGQDGKDGTDGKDGKDGVDGVSPTITETPITGGYEITITDVAGTNSFNLYNGADGVNGTNGVDGVNGIDGFSPYIVSTPITNGYQVNITDVNGTNTFNLYNGANGIDGVNGINGINGVDGFSPYITETPIANGYQVNVTDVNGTNTFNLYNGADGINGVNGVNGINGNDGFSPYVNTTPLTNGYQVDITDANGTKSFNIYNGADGINGVNGINGINGVNGNDGFSPYVVSTPITDGYQINVTDVNGTNSFNIYNGTNYTITPTDYQNIADLVLNNINASGEVY